MLLTVTRATVISFDARVSNEEAEVNGVLAYKVCDALAIETSSEVIPSLIQGHLSIFNLLAFAVHHVLYH
jgi:hypothetical protein